MFSGGLGRRKEYVEGVWVCIVWKFVVVFLVGRTCLCVRVWLAGLVLRSHVCVWWRARACVSVACGACSAWVRVLKYVWIGGFVAVVFVVVVVVAVVVVAAAVVVVVVVVVAVIVVAVLLLLLLLLLLLSFMPVSCCCRLCRCACVCRCA